MVLIAWPPKRGQKPAGKGKGHSAKPNLPPHERVHREYRTLETKFDKTSEGKRLKAKQTRLGGIQGSFFEGGTLKNKNRWRRYNILVRKANIEYYKALLNFLEEREATEEAKGLARFKMGSQRLLLKQVENWPIE